MELFFTIWVYVTHSRHIAHCCLTVHIYIRTVWLDLITQTKTTVVQVVRDHYPRALRGVLHRPGWPPSDQRYAWDHRRARKHSRFFWSRHDLECVPNHQLPREHAIWHRRHCQHGSGWYFRRSYPARNVTRHRCRVSCLNPPGCTTECVWAIRTSLTSASLVAVGRALMT